MSPETERDGPRFSLPPAEGERAGVRGALGSGIRGGGSKILSPRGWSSHHWRPCRRSRIGGTEELHPPAAVADAEIVASAEAYPGDGYIVSHIIDGNPQTEYSSTSLGTNTFIEFDFGAPTIVAAFRHLDRNDPATVGSSELTFLDAAGGVVGKVPVRHVNQRAGVTFLAWPAPVTARRVRWQVTELGAGLPRSAGRKIAFFTAGKAESLPAALGLEVRTPQLLERQGAALVPGAQGYTSNYPYAEPVDGVLRVTGAEGEGGQVQVRHPDCEPVAPGGGSRQADQGGGGGGRQKVASREVTLKPVRRMQIFLLPHSHNDIGYTALQADVEKKQNSNIETGLRLAKATADYPEGARFKWNTEVLWCVDNYLRAATPEQRAAFMAAVKSGQIGLDAFYCNILTGLCRPEELLNLMRYATQLSAETGVPITSAMISDVPGYTWGTVSAMAQAGVKYFSFAPNYFDRMGSTMKEWQDRPFWWKGPDGKQRVLCWCPSRGYALGHIIGDGEALARFIPDYLVELEANGYPFDITYLRWNVHGDNGSPDEKVADVVRDWNARYVWPRLIISTTAAAFSEFEKRYQQAARVQRRLHTFTGKTARRRPRGNRTEPRHRRAPGAGGNPLGPARPRAVSRGGLPGRLAERAALQRAYVGRP